MKKKTAKKELTSKVKLKKAWNEWKGTLILLLMLCAFRSAIADWNDVPTGSMKPTILEGDRVIVNKLAYDLKIPFTNVKLLKWGNPERGDIVVFYSPVDGTRFIKRIIAVPGDEIAVLNNQVILNGEPQTISKDNIFCDYNLRNMTLQENLAGRTHSIMLTPENKSIKFLNPTKVPDDSYFVMGDNRDNSFDSRYFGFVTRDSILGQGTAVAFSLNRAFIKLE